jgi:hypothetical protein
MYWNNTYIHINIWLFRWKNILSAFAKKPNLLILPAHVQSLLLGHIAHNTYIHTQQCIHPMLHTHIWQDTQKTKGICSQRSSWLLCMCRYSRYRERYAYVQIRYSGVLPLQRTRRRPTCRRSSELPILGVSAHFLWEPDRCLVSYRKRCQGDVSEAAT